MKKAPKLIYIFAITLGLFLNAQVQAATWFPSSVEIVAVHEGENIQAAVNKAKTGSVILVSPGVYYETVKLKKGIVLRSETGPEQTTIDGSHNSGTVVEMADESTLDGFSITGRVDTDKAPEHHAIECNNVAAVVKNNIIRDNKGTGIYVAGKGASATVTNNRVYGNAGAGIGIRDRSRASIVGNQCYGNTLAGIGVQDGASPKVENNKCFQNQMAGIGVRHKESAPVLENNECYNNELAGIGLELAATATLKNNYLHENGRAGLGMNGGSSAVVENNKIEKNTLSGIGMLEKCTILAKNNKINNNAMSGMTVMDGSKATIEGNIFQANGTQGIICSNAEAIVKNNKVLNNIHHGISFYRDAKGEVSGNEINENGANDKRGSGILVVSSDELTIHHNEFNNNYGPGVYTRRCSPLIEENTFLNDFVFVKFHAMPTIRKNIFYSQGKSGGKTVKSGVDVREISHPIIAENEFYGKFAISIRENSNPLVLKNKFSGSHKDSIQSARSGVKIDRTCAPSIIDNVFYNDNKILATGDSITKNILISRAKPGAQKKSGQKNVKPAVDVKADQHGTSTVIIAGNLFLGEKKDKKK